MTNNQSTVLITMFGILLILGSFSVAANEINVVVLDTEVIDWRKQNPQTADKPENLARARRMTEQLRCGLDSPDHYKVVEMNDSTRNIIEEYRSRRRNLYKCNDCMVKIGEAAGVDRVFVPWVEMVSSLIQHQNVVVYDVKTGKARPAAPPVYFRGNKGAAYDSAWRYATRALLEQFYDGINASNDMADSCSLNPAS